MKKLITIAAMAMLVGTTVSWAETNDVLSLNIPITLKAKLSDNGTVTDADLGGDLSVAELQFIRAGVTSDVFTVIGDSISLLTTTNGGGTNTILQGVGIWSEISSASDSKGKFVTAFGQDVTDLAAGTSTNLLSSVISNSVLVVTGTEKESNDKTNLNAKVVGVWKDGDTSVTGSIKSKK